MFGQAFFRCSRAVLVCAAAAVCGQGAWADRLDAKLDVIDRLSASKQGFDVTLDAPRVITPTKFGYLDGLVAREPVGAGAWEDAVRTAARRHGIPEIMFLKLVKTESNFDPRAVSHKGAIGLAQLMPGTARDLGVDPHKPEENLDGGARYLSMMKARFGSWRLALAAYNAGPGAVETHGGVPPFRETQNYVTAILGR